MQKLDSCRHRPKYRLVYNYAFKEYTCIKCGKSIKMKHESLFSTIMFVVTMVFLFVTGLYKLLHTNITVFVLLFFLLSSLVWWLPGSLIYFYLLPFNVVDDEPGPEQENEKMD